MDFGALLSAAKKNENNKQSVSYYPTKFTPPKKENRQTQILSNNIKLFLAKKEEEEKRKAVEEALKKKNLLALRDHKAQSRINKHLKVCKAANKSVLDDAVDMENTAITMAGPSQPDEDDYGYVSQEASAFYNKLMNKYSTQPEEKSIFAPAGKKTVKDIASTKDRVKQALKQQEIDESQGHRRKRKSTTKNSEEDTKIVTSDEKKTSDKTNKSDKPKPKNRPLPPAMDFGQLLKLAAQKQHEPIVIEVKPKPEEPERLMTKKQMKEYAREKESRDAREERNRTLENNVSSNRLTVESNKPDKHSDSKSQESQKTKKISAEKIVIPKKPVISSSDRNATNLKSTHQKSKHKDDISDERRKLEIERKKLEEMRRSIEEEKRKLNVIKKKNNEGKTNTNVSTNKVPNKIGNSSVRDLGRINSTKQNTERSLNSKPSKPYSDKNLKMSKNSKIVMKNKKYTNGRAIFNDDDDEYDSELDDFIDNGEEDTGNEDYSKYISEIFGYDKNKYKNYYDEEDDDLAMESNFAQQLKEEYVSTKIGIMEDLEDIRMESMEKKRKALIKKKRKV